jgi:hypothetical protein
MAWRIPMSTDPIIDELDRLRAEQMAQFNFDFESFYRDLKEQEKLLPRAVQSHRIRRRTNVCRGQ